MEDTLSFFPHAEGYIKVTYTGAGSLGGGAMAFYNYVYNYTDHLGNIRVRYTVDPEIHGLAILEENHYYPFGLKHNGYSGTHEIIGVKPGTNDIELVPVTPETNDPYTYKYNGKELQDELGLNWHDYGARNYQADLGRFFNMDNMTEMYETLSPYNYTGNNPVNFIDVNGEWIYVYDGDNQYRYENGQTQQQVDGQWTAIDETVELSDFAISVIAGLSDLENNGKQGKSLINHFSNDENNVHIRYKEGPDTNKARGEDIFMDHNLKVNTWVQGTDGNPILQESPFHISLGHEIAHVQDPIKVYFGSMYWYGNTGTSEIWASHIENKLRAESGLPLRTHYGGMWSTTDKKEYPNPLSTLIDKKGNSVYYRRNDKRVRYENRVTPNQGGIREGKNAHGGQILNARYNYNE